MRGREEGRSGVGWGFESCGDGCVLTFFFFFSSRRRHTRFDCDWSSDVCSSDLMKADNCVLSTLLVPFDADNFIFLHRLVPSMVDYFFWLAIWCLKSSILTC